MTTKPCLRYQANPPNLHKTQGCVPCHTTNLNWGYLPPRKGTWFKTRNKHNWNAAVIQFSTIVHLFSKVGALLSNARLLNGKLFCLFYTFSSFLLLIWWHWPANVARFCGVRQINFFNFSPLSCPWSSNYFNMDPPLKRTRGNVWWRRQAAGGAGWRQVDLVWFVVWEFPCIFFFCATKRGDLGESKNKVQVINNVKETMIFINQGRGNTTSPIVWQLIQHRQMMSSI